MSASPTIEEAVLAIASYGLPGAGRLPPMTALGERDWDDLIRHVRAERLAGHLVDAIEHGGFPATPSQRAEAIEVHAAGLFHVLLLEQRLLDTAASLEEVGIDYRLLKGTAVAHTAYRHPSLRLFGDIDLLVRSEQFDRAAEVLTSLGARRTAPPLRAGFDRRFGKGAGFGYPDRLEVDLHRTLVPGYFGLRVDTDALFQRPTMVRVGNRDLPALGLEERFLHACYHAVLGHCTDLATLRDVAQFALETPLDASLAIDLAGRWSGHVLVAQAVATTWETFALADIVPLSVWASRYQPSGEERRALDGYRGPGRSEAARALVSLRAIEGVRAKAAFLRGLLLPDRSYLEWAGRERLQWLRRSRRALRRAGTP